MEQYTRLRSLQNSLNIPHIADNTIKEIINDTNKKSTSAKKLKFDIGGTVFKTCVSTAKSIQGSLLFELDETSQYYDKSEGAYFFDRDAALFKHILDAHRDGEIHVPQDVCVIKFRREMTFWGIPIQMLSPCCWRRYYEVDSDLSTLDHLVSYVDQSCLSKVTVQIHPLNDSITPPSLNNNTDDIHKESGKTHNKRKQGTNLRSRLWLFLEEPKSSKAALIWCFVYICVVLLSMVVFMLWLDPSGRIDSYLSPDSKKANAEFKHLRMFWDMQHATSQATTSSTIASTLKPHTIRSTLKSGIIAKSTIAPTLIQTLLDLKAAQMPEDKYSDKQEMFVTTDPHHAVFAIDCFCMLFFWMELIVHFWVCPCKRRYLCNIYNVIKVILAGSLIPAVMCEMRKDWLLESEHAANFYLAVKCMGVFRLLLIFRLRKFYCGLQVMLLSLERSIKELCLLLIMLCILVTIYGCFIFVAEIDTDMFPNIRIGMWWALVTMTTIGYGDYYPTETMGYIAGAVCAINGLIIMALPIAAIASNFADFYSRQSDLDNHLSAVRLSNERKNHLQLDVGLENNNFKEKTIKPEDNFTIQDYN